MVCLRRTHHCHQLPFCHHAIHVRQDGLLLFRTTIFHRDGEACPEEAANALVLKVGVRRPFFILIHADFAAVSRLYTLFSRETRALAARSDSKGATGLLDLD